MPPNASRRTATLLLVDDTPENLSVLADLLASDYRILVANSGPRALHLAAATPRPDLILLDVMMPGMDGYTVLARLREIPGCAEVPVIFVTAMTAIEDEQRGFDLGAVDYITKPIRPPIVRARVKAQLELKDARDWLRNKNEILEAEVAALADPDAAENWRVWLAFRDRLIAGGTLEAAYLALFREGARGVPGLFLDQLVHAILRGVLEGTPSALRARAGELLFRGQTASVEGGRVRLADAETVEMYAASGGFGSLGRLVVEAGTAPRSVELDVLDERTQHEYWARAGRHDTVLDITFGAAGLDALAHVLEAWVAHFLAVTVSIQPVRTIRDERWVWHVGSTPEAPPFLTTSTAAPRWRRSGWPASSPCSGWSSPTPPPCAPTSPAAPSIWRWP